MSETAGGPAPGRGGEPLPAAGDHGAGRPGGEGHATAVAGLEARLAETEARLAEAEARLAEAEARLAEAEARLAEVEDQRLRALADLDNVRKRCAAQIERTEAETRAQVARQWLPVVDNLERALEHAAADPRTIIEGIQAVRQQALEVLGSLGFPRRDDTGRMFDPARHEAVASLADPGVPSGTVVRVVLPAYGEGDRQLRPAQVVVAKAD